MDLEYSERISVYCLMNFMRSGVARGLRWFFGCGLLMFAVCQLVAGEIKTVDRSQKTDKNAFYVVFCARESSLLKPSLGHAFVIFRKTNDKGIVLQEHARGIYPKKGSKAAFGEVPGELRNEQATDRATYRLTVKVDAAVYARALAVETKWKQVLEGTYDVLALDCVTFVSDVAGSVGLKRPERWDAKLPESFLSGLMKLND